MRKFGVSGSRTEKPQLVDGGTQNDASPAGLVCPAATVTPAGDSGVTVRPATALPSTRTVVRTENRGGFNVPDEATVTGGVPDVFTENVPVPPVHRSLAAAGGTGAGGRAAQV